MVNIVRLSSCCSCVVNEAVFSSMVSRTIHQKEKIGKSLSIHFRGKRRVEGGGRGKLRRKRERESYGKIKRGVGRGVTVNQGNRERTKRERERAD